MSLAANTCAQSAVVLWLQQGPTWLTTTVHVSSRPAAERVPSLPASNAARAALPAASSANCIMRPDSARCKDHNQTCFLSFCWNFGAWRPHCSAQLQLVTGLSAQST